MLIRLAERRSAGEVHAGTMTGAGGRLRRLGPWAHTGFSGYRLLGAGDSSHCLEHGFGLVTTVKKLPDPGGLCSR